MKVNTGDTVIVISGKDKGAKGKIIESYPKCSKVLVEGVNRVKKHTSQSRNERGVLSGGILVQESAIHISNVMLVTLEGTPTRISYRIDAKTGNKVRTARTNGKDV